MRSGMPNSSTSPPRIITLMNSATWFIGREFMDLTSGAVHEWPLQSAIMLLALISVKYFVTQSIAVPAGQDLRVRIPRGLPVDAWVFGTPDLEPSSHRTQAG